MCHVSDIFLCSFFLSSLTYQAITANLSNTQWSTDYMQSFLSYIKRGHFRTYIFMSTQGFKDIFQQLVHFNYLMLFIYLLLFSSVSHWNCFFFLSETLFLPRPQLNIDETQSHYIEEKYKLINYIFQQKGRKQWEWRLQWSILILVWVHYRKALSIIMIYHASE